MAKFEQFGQADVNEETLLLGLVCTYVALVPTLSFIPSLGPYNEKRALQIGMLLIIAGGLLGSHPVRQRWLEMFSGLPPTAQWGLGGVLGLGLLSSALAPAPFYAFLEVGHFVLIFVAAGVVASEVRRVPKRTQWALMGAVAASGVLYAIYFGVGYVSHLAIADIKPWPDGGTNYANIRVFNHYQTWTLPLFAAVLLSLPKSWRVGRGTAFGLISLWWALVFASGVRGTVVAMGIAAVGVAFLFRWQAGSWLLIQTAGFLLGLGLYYLLFSEGGAPQAAGKFGDPAQYSERLQHWQVCLEMTWTNPVLGIGPMHFAWAPYSYVEPASPHSALMQWLVEWGLPSTLTMIGLTVWGGWRWMIQERKTIPDTMEGPEAVSVALVASVLAGAAHSQVSGLIVAPLSQILLMLVGGWAWGRYESANRATETDVSIRSHAFLGTLLLGSMVIVGGSFQDLAKMEERRSTYLEAAYRGRLAPRYWNPGHIGIPELDL